MNHLAPLAYAFALVRWLVLGSAPTMAQTQLAHPAISFKVQGPDGVSVAAQEWGYPDGPEILFIHGFSQSHLSWSRQFTSELAKSFRMITYDIRGHGDLTNRRTRRSTAITSFGRMS